MKHVSVLSGILVVFDVCVVFRAACVGFYLSCGCYHIDPSYFSSGIPICSLLLGNRSFR